MKIVYPLFNVKALPSNLAIYLLKGNYFLGLLEKLQFTRASKKKKPLFYFYFLVASPGIEPGSRASEALILSIVLRGPCLFHKMTHIAAKNFNRNCEQYYTEKFSYHHHSIWTQKLLNPF